MNIVVGFLHLGTERSGHVESAPPAYSSSCAARFDLFWMGGEREKKGGGGGGGRRNEEGG